jgi:hypothetical protein
MNEKLLHEKEFIWLVLRTFPDSMVVDDIADDALASRTTSVPLALERESAPGRRSADERLRRCQENVRRLFPNR